jgi:hypothetical protein
VADVQPATQEPRAFTAGDVVRFTRDGKTFVGNLQYRYVNRPSWLVHVPGYGEMWADEPELEHQPEVGSR